MPKKVEEVVTAEAPEETKVAAPARCGHIDMHSIGTDGKPDHPTCDREPGHTGDHHGTHKMRVESNRTYDQIYGKLIGIEYEIVDGEAYWNDAAGTPVKDIPVEPLPKRDGGKRDEIRRTIEELMRP